MTSAPSPGSGVAFIEGRFCPIEEAKISVIDMAVTKGDSTYDVVHVWKGRFYRLDDHLDRFLANMKALRLDPGLDRREIEDVLHECVSRAGLREASGRGPLVRLRVHPFQRAHQFAGRGPRRGPA
ncbi:MAG TPA: aminotransferase class IV [Jiangellaceae bacterium]